MAIFKVRSEYLRFPFKVKVDYFILYSILVYSCVIFLIFFALNKRRCTFEAERFFHSNVYMFKHKQKWTTAYQYAISRTSHISVSIFTIRTLRTQEKLTEVSLLSSTIQLLQSDLPIKYLLDYKSRPPKFRAESK